MLINMKITTQRSLRFHLVLLTALVSGGIAWADDLSTMVAKRHPVDLTLPFEATVEAMTQTTLTSQVSGRVIDMQVDVGQPVRKGDLLLRIDAREASEMAAGATAQYINAKANYDRLKNLHQQKFISAAALDKAKADFEAAQAARGQASVGVGHATVTAPISGLVAQRLIEQGETAAPGRPLLTIYDPSGLRVTASIPQYQLPQIRNVKQARIEFPEVGHWADSKFVTLLPTADAATHVSQVRVGLPDDLAGIVPGMFARVHFVLGQVVRMTVPSTAIVRRGEVAAVYVKTESGALVLRQLRLGERLGGDIEVLAGLAEGEQVVLDAVRASIELKARQAQEQKK